MRLLLNSFVNQINIPKHSSFAVTNLSYLIHKNCLKSVFDSRISIATMPITRTINFNGGPAKLPEEVSYNYDLISSYNKY